MGKKARIARFLLAATLSAALAGASPVFAVTNAAIEAKRAEAEAARDVLADYETELSEMVERFNAVTEELQQTRALIAENREELGRARTELEEAEETLASRAEGMYRRGPVSVLEVLLGTTSFQDFLTRVDLLSRIGRQDAEVVDQVESAKQRLEDVERTLESREAEQLVLRAQVRQARSEIESATRRQKAYVASLESDVAQLVREEEERQRRLAEERARKAAEKAKRLAAEAEARRRAEEAARGVVSNPGAGSVPITGEGHPEVVDIAMRYLGVPYVWGGTSPSGFDCSGLVKYCYAEIGIGLPRTSRSQFLEGTRVPADRPDLLMPGDLVFFGTNGDPGRVHHVGIYVGDGTFVHAPATGDVVRVSSLTERIRERADYVGGSRL